MSPTRFRGLLVIATLSAAGCAGEHGNCSVASDPTLLVHVDPAVAVRELKANGACEPPTCDAAPDGGQGCVEWRSKMTGGAGTTCILSLETNDGGPAFTARVGGGQACGPLGREVTFSSTGGSIVSSSPPDTDR